MSPFTFIVQLASGVFVAGIMGILLDAIWTLYRGFKHPRKP